MVGGLRGCVGNPVSILPNDSIKFSSNAILHWARPNKRGKRGESPRLLGQGGVAGGPSGGPEGFGGEGGSVGVREGGGSFKEGFAGELEDGERSGLGERSEQRACVRIAVEINVWGVFVFVSI